MNMGEIIKCLTLKQPWASLVVEGHKEIETRSWETKYRGELYIHASSKFYFGDLELCRIDRFFKEAIPDPTKVITGAILGKVTLVDCVRTETLDGKISKKEKAFGDYSPGRFAWILENPQQITAFPQRGALGIWSTELRAT